MNDKSFAPIILVAYNRYEHFKKTLKALSINDFSNQSNLYIFVDGPKQSKDIEQIKKIVDEAGNFKLFFKNLEVIERKENLGLSENITKSVTNIINRYGRVIVLEDDIVPSKNFLKYMNDALDHYSLDKNIWHINACSPVNDFNKENETYFSRLMNCWGWGTWKDRWAFYQKDTNNLVSQFSKEEIKRFNFDNTANFWDQVIENKKGIINTWAIFWYATIFKKNGLCLSPYLSYVKNIGFDGTGSNSGNHPDLMLDNSLNENGFFSKPKQMNENLEQLNKIKEYYSKTTKIKKLKFYIKQTLPLFLIKFLKKIDLSHIKF